MNINDLPQGSYTPVSPAQGAMGATQTAQPSQGLNINSLPQGSYTPVQPQQSASVGGFVGNALGSLGNLAGGAISAVGNIFNPNIDQNTVANVGKLGTGALEEAGNAIGATNFNTPATQSFDNVKNFYNQRYGISDLLSGNVQGALGKMANTFYTDPAGAAADFSMLLEGGGALLGKLGEAGEAGAAADAVKAGDTIAMGGQAENGAAVATPSMNSLTSAGNAIQGAGEAINPLNAMTKPLSTIGESDAANNLVKGGFSQITGIQPSDIDTITKYPDEFTPSSIANYNRSANADSINEALQSRIDSLSEIGKGYSSFRDSEAQIPVQQDYLKNLITSKTGLNVEGDGTASYPYELKATGDSSIRDPGDVNALQKKILNQWNPEFAKGYLTPNQFLNLRQDLGTMAKFGRDIGKSDPLDNLAGVMRGQLNTDLRGEIPGLAETDAKFGSQAQELNELRKNILNKDGTLNPNAVNRIANSMGKGKDAFLSQLEDIKPGITKDIAVGKAKEAIQSLKGNVVGTYGRTAGTLGAAAAGLSGGPLMAVASALAEQVVTSPEVSVRLLKAIGKSSPLYDAFKSALVTAKNATPSISRIGNASQIIQNGKRNIKVTVSR